MKKFIYEHFDDYEVINTFQEVAVWWHESGRKIIEIFIILFSPVWIWFYNIDDSYETKEEDNGNI